MRIGFDLDNTIISYDALFHRVATEKGLVNATVGATKREVKAWIMEHHGNEVWTQLQGEVYGPRLEAAVPYEGALEFVRRCRAVGHRVYIISHKTQFPASGLKVDLREAALRWLASRGLFEIGMLEREEVEFHETRVEKIRAIERRACEIFIDDLPEIFQESNFPPEITRILFDPEKAFGDTRDYLCNRSWEAISRAVFYTLAEGGSDMPGPFGQLATKLLDAAGLPKARAIHPLRGGRNNKVYRVSTAAGDVLFKAYFQSPHDTRDRLGHEFTFLHHLARTRSTYVPRPLASMPVEQVALMEFIHGVRPAEKEVDETHIDQAIEFFLEANQGLYDLHAITIEPASEACFSIAQHLACTESRVARLESIVQEDEIDAEAVAFVATELLPAWRNVRAAIEAEWPTEEARQALLPQAERCLSPSDFGFHNSLRLEDGSLRFLDFEYAGWDDPAKLIADFANQPDLLLDRALSDRFRSAVIAVNVNPQALAKRVAALEPLYQVKWACICLNDFLEFGRTRLQFTDGLHTDRKKRRIFQLTRSRQMFGRLRAS